MIFFFFFFLMNGNTEWAHVPFLKSASLKKRKRNVMKRIKFYKISKKGNEKKIANITKVNK